VHIIRKLISLSLRINNWLLFLFTVGFIFFSTVIIYAIEPETFGSLFNGFWWVMTTVTTVGYGDYFPVTTAGKCFAVLLYIVGIGLIGVVIGKVVDSFSIYRLRRLKGKLKYTGEQHIILIGWNHKAKFAVEEILETDPRIDVVIIDDLEEAPFVSDRVHYVRGDAADEDILLQANLPSAKSVIIFAKDTIADPSLIDGKTLLIATSVSRLAPDIHTNVEIMSERNIKNFEHIEVDEFILSHGMISRLAVRSTFFNGVTNIFRQLLSSRVGDDLHKIKKQPKWKTYRDAFNDLLQQGATLIADGANLSINRKLDEAIPEGAHLYVICDKATFQKLNS
jgi:voltage-gated potassium channel